MSKIRFSATPFTINSWLIIQLPIDASKELPSRGMTMVQGTLNGVEFHAPLEPDGKGSHWFRVDDELIKKADVRIDSQVNLEVENMKDWFRPEVPKDLAQALKGSASALALWNDITPKAQWEWIRWIRSTNNEQTRQKRIGVALSKLNSGERRPCCFNSTLCSEPYVSHKWKLIERGEL